MQKSSGEVPANCIVQRSSAKRLRVGLLAEPIDIVSQIFSLSKYRFQDSYAATTQKAARPGAHLTCLSRVTLREARRKNAIRLKHHAYTTEKSYVYWAKRPFLSHSIRHPLEMGETESSEFLTYLTIEERVAAATGWM